MPRSAKKTIHVAIVAAYFNPSIVEPMIISARQALEVQGAVVDYLIKVPGCYEMPLTVHTLLRQTKVQAVVVLGYIERGQTLHGEVMGHVVHRALIDLQLQYKKPIGLGIIGPGATLEQAKERKEAYGQAAAEAALAHYRALQDIT